MCAKVEHAVKAPIYRRQSERDVVCRELFQEGVLGKAGGRAGAPASVKAAVGPPVVSTMRSPLPLTVPERVRSPDPTTSERKVALFGAEGSVDSLSRPSYVTSAAPV